MKLVVVAAFVVLNAVSFLVYRAAYSPDAAASSLLTSKHHAADNLSRDEGESQAKLATPDAPAVAAEPTSEPSAGADAIAAEQPSVAERTNSPTEETTSAPRAQRTRVKQPARKHVEETPAKPAVATKPAADKTAETKAAVESKPAAETKAPIETKSADKAKDKAKDSILEMEANPYKRGE
jgi:hypothetical protein